MKKHNCPYLRNSNDCDHKYQTNCPYNDNNKCIFYKEWLKQITSHRDVPTAIKQAIRERGGL